MNRTKFYLVVALVLSSVGLSVLGAADSGVNLGKISLPQGFSIEVVTDAVPNARAMVLGDKGTLFVGTRSAGNVYAVSDIDSAQPTVRVVASELSLPTGVAFRDGSLYVAEVARVLRYDNIETQSVAAPAAVTVAELPSERHHGWRYIAFGPDDRLYVAIGAPCNICDRSDEGFATIIRMNPDGSGREVFAEGIRNSVGFTWHPETKALVFTDNGRDHLGNDSPPGELNMAPHPGLHFGYPFCHAGTIKDPEFGAAGACEDTVGPLQALGPHVAPLGVKFYTGSQFPESYVGDVFIAEHGSWNRDEPIGYRITRVELDGERAVSYEVFADGWLEDGKAWGRPVDLLVEATGSMLVSDDKAGVIYRISAE